MTARQPRTARPARAARRRRPSARGVPSAAWRRRMGPQPPDHIVTALVAALPGGHQDAAGGPPLGSRWRAAVARAGAAITAAARRGVRGALGTSTAQVPDPNLPAGWAANLTDRVRRALQAGLEAAVGAITEAVFGEHTRQIAEIALRMGAEGYIWTTMKDERVRQLHRKLEGTHQRWDDPPLAGLPDFHGHPGEAAGPCRCVPYPVI